MEKWRIMKTRRKERGKKKKRRKKRERKKGTGIFVHAYFLFLKKQSELI